MKMMICQGYFSSLTVYQMCKTKISPSTVVLLRFETDSSLSFAGEMGGKSRDFV